MTLNDRNEISSIILSEHRCSCGKLLFKGLLLSSTLEIKCKRCDAMNIIGNQDTSKSKVHYSILFDMDAQIVDASPSATEILGYTREELLSAKMQHIDPLFTNANFTNLSKIKDLTNGEPLVWETIHQNKDGAFSLVSTTLRYIKNQRGTYGLAAFENVQRPTSLQDDGTQCVLSAKINADGICTHISAPLATLLGYSSMEMLGNYIFHFHPKADQEKQKQMLLQNLHSEKSFKALPYAMLCKNNESINLDSYFASDYNERGQFTGFKMLSWKTA